MLSRRLVTSYLRKGGIPSRAGRAASTSEQSGKHDPYGEDGSGFYSDNTKGCYDVILNSKDLAEKCVVDILDKRANQTDPFVIADYGTADGGTSMPLFYSLTSKIRETHADLPISVWYEDQAQNDFKSLFLRLHGYIPGPPSYLLDFEHVNVMASGTTFYKQCFPPETVDLAYCATAMHWLTSTPVAMKDCLHSAMLEEGPELDAFNKQAAKDWESILLHRATELKPGGYMVIVNFAKDVNGNFLGTTDRIPGKMHQNFRDTWRQMKDEGVITDAEYVNTNFPNQYRTMEECRAPFDDPNNRVSQAGLQLKSIEERQVPCPYQLGWVRDGGDALEKAKEIVTTTRTWSNSVFLSALDSSRTNAEKEAIVDQMYDRYTLEVSKDPSGHAMDYVHTYMVIQKAA